MTALNRLTRNPVAPMTIDQYCARPVGRIMAVLLLVVQGMTGVSVAWAHANQPPIAVVIEAGHRAHCPAIHDESRCPICEYELSLITPPDLHSFSQFFIERYTSIPIGIAAADRIDGRFSALPRAPPAFLS